MSLERLCRSYGISLDMMSVRPRNMSGPRDRMNGNLLLGLLLDFLGVHRVAEHMRRSGDEMPY